MENEQIINSSKSEIIEIPDYNGFKHYYWKLTFEGKTKRSREDAEKEMREEIGVLNSRKDLTMTTKELVGAQDEYIKFLENHANRHAVFLHSRGMDISKEVFEEGELLREKIKKHSSHPTVTDGKD